jgi:hypothetical protein
MPKGCTDKENYLTLVARSLRARKRCRIQLNPPQAKTQHRPHWLGLEQRQFWSRRGRSHGSYQPRSRQSAGRGKKVWRDSGLAIYGAWGRRGIRLSAPSRSRIICRRRVLWGGDAVRLGMPNWRRRSVLSWLLRSMFVRKSGSCKTPSRAAPTQHPPQGYF